MNSRRRWKRRILQGHRLSTRQTSCKRVQASHSSRIDKREGRPVRSLGDTVYVLYQGMFIVSATESTSFSTAARLLIASTIITVTSTSAVLDAIICLRELTDISRPLDPSVHHHLSLCVDPAPGIEEGNTDTVLFSSLRDLD
ncbi:hypothetical protein BV25DRAFT_181509 [Artomyces pyxidatus]|uniref:Uncharacterized protein n=1 Tax=Artomyces pyxidatus TaxID=48021 RepID=A0ACB8T8F3_9AGAM|nr:hypothetical protein BV25DRAFT_181509 [Artomyces pyxidatus]